MARHGDIGDFAPGDRWADRFLFEYEIHQAIDSGARRKRKQKSAENARRNRVKLASMPAEQRLVAEAAIERARSRNASVRSRLQAGFNWQGGWFGGEGPADGYYRPSLTFRGLMSDWHPLLKLFVQKTRRASRGLKTGIRKDVVGSGDSKLLALDQPTVTWNEEMRGVHRVDIDRVFASWEALRTVITGAGLPLPNLAVAFVDAKGRVVRPHLYWLLADSVCVSAHGMPRAIRLMQAVDRGLVSALLGIGADPGGLSNSLRGKNPLSPLWTTCVMAEEPYQLTKTRAPRGREELVALAEHVRLDVTLEELHRDAAERVAPELTLADGRRVKSNQFFTLVQRRAFDLIEEHHPRGRGRGSREEFSHAVAEYAWSVADPKAQRQRVARAIAQRVADYAWVAFDPAKRQKKRPQQGRCWKECRGKTLGERRQIGGRDVAARRRETTVGKLVVAYRGLIGRGAVAAGEMPTDTVLAAAAGVATKTVQRARRQFLATVEVDRRSIDKKLSQQARGTRAAILSAGAATDGPKKSWTNRPVTRTEAPTRHARIWRPPSVWRLRPFRPPPVVSTLQQAA